MPTLKIPTPLRPYVNGQAEVPVAGATVAEAMESLFTQFPAFRPHLANSQGNLRPFVNLFLAGQNVRDLGGMATPLPPDGILSLVPSIAGG
jgi:molybdopterin converting factor small subunit